MPRAKWRLTAIADFTPKVLGEPSAAHSEGSQILMKSVFLLVGGRLPILFVKETLKSPVNARLIAQTISSANCLGVKLPSHLKTL
jgi:hypothetical protein